MRAATVITIGILLCVACDRALAAEPAYSLHIEDDLFTGVADDADYTGGVAINVAKEHYEFEFGAAAFTPKNISSAAVITDDRPYAGLIYFSGAIVQRHDDFRSSVTALMLGYLGSDLVPRAQRSVHRAMGSVEPEGWRHQISDGGEPTARLMHERQWASEVVRLSGSQFQWLYRAGAGVGFLTDVNAGVAARWGRFSDPRWGIHASATGLSDRAVFSHADDRDRFLYGAVSARVPFYNALLQGQFRDTDFTVPSDARRHFVPEVTLGFVLGLSKGRDLHYFIRAQRSDIRLPERSDTTIYGGFTLSW